MSPAPTGCPAHPPAPPRRRRRRRRRILHRHRLVRLRTNEADGYDGGGGDERGAEREGRCVAVNQGRRPGLGAVAVDGEVRRRRGGRKRVEERRAERTTDLLGRVDHGAGDAGVGRRNANERRAVQRHEDETQSEAHDDLSRKDMAEISRVDPDLREPRKPEGSEHEPAGHDERGARTGEAGGLPAWRRR